MKFRNISHLQKYRERIKLSFHQTDVIRVRICITGCRANGSLTLLKYFSQEIDRRGLSEKIQIVPTGCQKFCSGAPVISVDMSEGTVMYHGVSVKDVPAIIQQTVNKGKIIPHLVVKEKKFFDYQTIQVSKNCGYINPFSLKEYLWQDGFCGLEKVLMEMTPENVIEAVKKSRLRGRGGAGFPTWWKWELTRKNTNTPRYLVCNGDEGDPGAFMDRALLEGSPYQIIEGILIAAYAIGAEKGFVYVRAEYPIAVEHLQHAIAECYRHGLLGRNILGQQFSFDLEIKEGAGAFVCGEETALMLSIEGQRGMPRPRPPFPAQAGLWGKPTCINNVETFANIPLIITQGEENFAALGTMESGGTKLFSLAGKLRNTGLAEIRLGTSLGRVILDIGGGALPGRKIKGVQIGGPSGGCLPVRLFNTPIDYETLSNLGAIMGSGGMIVVDDKVCMVELARYFLDFVQKESCGKCVPCRVGTKRLLELLTRITKGQAEISDLEKLQELGELVRDSSLCGLGQTAPNPVLSTLRYFPEEYQEHIKLKYCRAGQCRALTFTPCENACPAKVRVPDYVEAIRKKDFLEAYRIISEDIPFPSVCGRICYHPCESMCRRQEIDSAVAIRELKKFVSAYARAKGYSVKNFTRFLPETDKKVAIVGGGPAGLTCAWQLTKEGIRVTIFEKESKLGGMLRYYLPEFRLPENILNKEIRSILNPRMKVCYGKILGKNLHLQELTKDFDAVFLALGAPHPQKFDIPGVELPRVWQGLEFLRLTKMRKPSTLGKQVAVVGGGNVALDCARSALRLGAKKVLVFYRRTRELMPAHRWELEEAEKEGVEFQFLVTPVQVRASGKHLEVILQEYELSEQYDVDGRKKSRQVPGRIISMKLDNLIVAVGQNTQLSHFLPDTNIDWYSLATDREKIFVGGDFLRGPATVIDAIGDGKRAAGSIVRYLKGEKILCWTEEKRTLPEMVDKKQEALDIGRQTPRTISLSRRRKTFAEVELTFTQKKAVLEAGRCLRCQLEK